jgi:hypothetical protein
MGKTKNLGLTQVDLDTIDLGSIVLQEDAFSDFSMIDRFSVSGNRHNFLSSTYAGERSATSKDAV